MSDVGSYGLFANVIEPDRSLRMGARVQILDIPGDPSRCRVSGLSRGGRRITKWVLKRRLGHFRLKWVYNWTWRDGLSWKERDEAEAYMLSRGYSQP